MTKLYYNGVERDMTEAEEAQRIIDTNNWNAKKVDVKLADLRIVRNNLLKDTDFWGASDMTMSSEMETYRQSLRDLTNGLDTVEKIANVTYPTKP
jgi:hypothetical protein|tara:strand:+ start:443 stop:727 length:285 start_codon:yes stop_codon:yes gene_type:complete